MTCVAFEKEEKMFWEKVTQRGHKNNGRKCTPQCLSLKVAMFYHSTKG